MHILLLSPYDFEHLRVYSALVTHCCVYYLTVFFKVFPGNPPFSSKSEFSPPPPPTHAQHTDKLFSTCRHRNVNVLTKMFWGFIQMNYRSTPWQNRVNRLTQNLHSKIWECTFGGVNVQLMPSGVQVFVVVSPVYRVQLFPFVCWFDTKVSIAAQFAEFCSLEQRLILVLRNLFNL